MKWVQSSILYSLTPGDWSSYPFLYSLFFFSSSNYFLLSLLMRIMFSFPTLSYPSPIFIKVCDLNLLNRSSYMKLMFFNGHWAGYFKSRHNVFGSSGFAGMKLILSLTIPSCFGLITWLCGSEHDSEDSISSSAKCVFTNFRSRSGLIFSKFYDVLL